MELVSAPGRWPRPVGRTTGAARRLRRRRPGRWPRPSPGCACPGTWCCWPGTSGAGKTTFAQGFGAGLGVAEPITSPTFTLVRQYPLGRRATPAPAHLLLHADVYRLDHLHEVVDLGLGELVEDGGVALVEWGDAAEPVLGDGCPVRAAGRRPRTTTSRAVTITLGRAGAPGPIAGTGLAGRARRPWRGDAGEPPGHRDGHRHGRGRRCSATTAASAERIHVGGRAHAELLAPAIEEVCAVVRAAPSADSTAIAVDVGPGLFTGLRVGVATAKALAQALGIGVLGVGSLDVLAAAAAATAVDAGAGRRRWSSVVDARRGEVFAAAYRLRPGRPAPAAGPGARPGPVRGRPAPSRSHPEALWRGWPSLGDGGRAGSPWWATAPSATASSWPPTRPLDLGLADELSAPPPLALARLARRRWRRGAGRWPAADLVPDYRRPADARINWEQRAPRRHRGDARAAPGPGR